MKEKLKTESAATVVFVAVAVLFTLIGVHLSLARLSNKIEATFYDGVPNGEYTSVSLADLLNNRVNYSTGLVTVAYNYGIDTENILTARNDLIDALEAEDIPAAFNANSRLEMAWNLVYSDLEGANISEKDATNAKAYAEDLTGSQRAISSNGYNGVVDNFYNRTLTAFPVSILRHAVFFTDGPDYFA